MKTWLVAASAAFVLLNPSLSGIFAVDQNIRQERVEFAKGASSATVEGQLKGDETVDYLLRAGAGQTLAVTLKKSNPSNYFNVLPPGGTDVAMFIGQTGEDFTGMLPIEGDYTIRVYLMRSAARRNESSDYALTVSVTGEALVPVPASQDAVLPGTTYHAQAPITCVAQAFGETKPQTCEAFVIRWSFGGTATVEIKQEGQFREKARHLRLVTVRNSSCERIADQKCFHIYLMGWMEKRKGDFWISASDKFSR